VSGTFLPAPRLAPLMAITIGNRQYERIVIKLDDYDSYPTIQRLKQAGHQVRWADRRTFDAQATNEGLVIGRSPDWREAVFVSNMYETVLVSHPGAFYCPVCLTPADHGKTHDHGNRHEYDCPRCGKYIIGNMAKAIVGSRRISDPTFAPRLSFAIRQATANREWPDVTKENLDLFVPDRLPDPRQQPFLMARWVAKESRGVTGKVVSISDPSELAAVIGTEDGDGVAYIARSMARKGLFEEPVVTGDGALKLCLTLDGWEMSRSTETVSASAEKQRHPKRQAVILTAIEVETRLVLNHLSSWQGNEEEVHGTTFLCGTFMDWDVAVVEVGPGNNQAAALATRALSHYKPEVALFVGIAGGRKDVQIGDVVVATKVCGYEFGKEGEKGFEPRGDVMVSAHRIESRAKAMRQSDDWRKRLKIERPDGKGPNLLVAPIAAGEKVVATRQGEVERLLRRSYGDTVAVEMEGRGFLQAAHNAHGVDAGVVRGISDLLGGKAKSDKQGGQELAADSASAVAFELLATLKSTKATSPGS
jgi:nucleoside phosphorylase